VEIRKSLITYGLPDLSSFNLKTPESQNRLCDLLEKAIETFEPRLRQVRISLEMQPSLDKSLRFKIEATLLVDPMPESVIFDTIAEISSGEYTVKGSD
jgi:type VI secretion system protein ImpF